VVSVHVVIVDELVVQFRNRLLLLMFGVYTCMKLVVVSWQTAASPFDQTIG